MRAHEESPPLDTPPPTGATPPNLYDGVSRLQPPESTGADQLARVIGRPRSRGRLGLAAAALPLALAVACGPNQVGGAEPTQGFDCELGADDIRLQNTDRPNPLDRGVVFNPRISGEDPDRRVDFVISVPTDEEDYGGVKHTVQRGQVGVWTAGFLLDGFVVRVVQSENPITSGGITSAEDPVGPNDDVAHCFTGKVEVDDDGNLLLVPSDVNLSDDSSGSNKPEVTPPATADRNPPEEPTATDRTTGPESERKQGTIGIECGGVWWDFAKSDEGESLIAVRPSGVGIDGQAVPIDMSEEALANLSSKTFTTTIRLYDRETGEFKGELHAVGNLDTSNPYGIRGPEIRIPMSGVFRGDSGNPPPVSSTVFEVLLEEGAVSPEDGDFEERWGPKGDGEKQGNAACGGPFEVIFSPTKYVLDQG